MPDTELFHGIAVLIDDEIEKDGATEIKTIRSQIEAAGCHVVTLSQLPKPDSIVNLRDVSFFILDWNLSGASAEEAGDGEILTGPAAHALRRQNTQQAISFLKTLKKVCVAPVFIFTNEDTTSVENQIKRHPELFSPTDPSHILVRRKSDVINIGVFDVLAKWMHGAPSVYVLKKWERAYAAAKHELFLDFYSKSVRWPVVLWKTYKGDSLDGSVEVGNLIGRNLLSRMTPFDFDLEQFETPPADVEAAEETSRDAVMLVLEGERFLPKKRLHDDSIAPGDVFKKHDNFYVNIRPDCDCIARDGMIRDAVQLYLLKGGKITNADVRKRYENKYGIIHESDTEGLIFGMTDGKTVGFQFSELIVSTWGDWKNLRIGRLLPPFLTRLQQRYAAYLQRPGLTRIPAAALPPALSEAVIPGAVPRVGVMTTATLTSVQSGAVSAKKTRSSATAKRKTPRKS